MIRIQFTMLDPDLMTDTAHLDLHDDGVDALSEELHSRHHDPDSVYHAGSGSNDRSTAHLDPHDDGVDGLGEKLHSRHHDPDSV
jgi:hypothetical protein